MRETVADGGRGDSVISRGIKMNMRGPSSFQDTVLLSRPCSRLPDLILEAAT